MRGRTTDKTRLFDFLLGCIVPSWRGDNYCDDGNNNEGCGYDGGDCCGSNVNKTYCQNCECLDPNNGGE